MNSENSRTNHSTARTINALFLVAGTCTGGGMLALPISSSSVGFWPSVTVMFAACVFMTITGLLFLEATLWMKQDAHIITMASKLLNRFGQIVCWLVYLFIGYFSLIAYVSGAGKELSFVATEILNLPHSNFLGSFIFISVFGGILYLGYRTVERVNTILFISMIVAYVIMIVLAQNEIKLFLLERYEFDLKDLFFISPLMLTTFSFPGIVPTIVPYLNRDIYSLRIAIIGGTVTTFIVYFIWLLVMFGSVPYEGSHGLKEAFLCDLPATECLHYAIQNPFLSYVAQFFAFFALTTSFLGIALALFDFLADGFKMPKIGSGKLVLTLMIAIPSLFFGVYFKRAFITALEMSGGIGDSLISGLIPAIMVWKGRYHFKLAKQSPYQVGGGKTLLIIIGIVSCCILACEVLQKTLSA
jgi:tyrosine-specific transport protein